MMLVLCAPGHIATAIREVADSLGETVRTATSTDDDLFMKALGCRTIVYVAEPRLIDACDTPNADRMRAVVRASHARGIQHVVAILPRGDAWREEAVVLQKDGVGYTILRSRPLLDELADATNFHATRSVWLPRGKPVDLVPRSALISAIRDAIVRDDWCGATIDVPSERMEMAEAMRRAAQIAGAGVSVHVTSPSMSFAMRKLSLWMGLAPPELETLCDRLGEGSPPGVAA